MNDIELDRLLDAWETPAPSPALRVSLRDQFPRRTFRSFGRPLRWVLAIAVASTTLAIATEQTNGNALRFFLAHIEEFLLRLRFNLELRQSHAILLRIRDSNPKVFVDGQPAPPPEVNGRYLSVHVRGDGIYWVMPAHAPELRGWIWNGSVHENVLEFEAGARHVRIECDRPVFNSEHGTYTLHLPE